MMAIKRIASSVYTVIRDAVEGYSRDQATHFAAAMAFYAVFAVAPLILIATAVTGLVWGPEAARTEVVTQVEAFVGPEARAFIVRLLENWQDRSSGIIATVVGGVTTAYLAFRVFDALRDTLNTIWRVRLRSDLSWASHIRKYLRSFVIMLLVGPMLLVSTVMVEVFTRIGPFMKRWTGLDLDIGGAPYFAITVFLLTLVFGVVYKWLPDVLIQWRDVWFGAAVTALFFSIGRSLIAYYMAHATTASLFGAAGSLVVLLFWIYYSAQIIFFGAEITQVYARRYGKGIQPDDTAIRIEYETG